MGLQLDEKNCDWLMNYASVWVWGLVFSHGMTWDDVLHGQVPNNRCGGSCALIEASCSSDMG